VTQIPPVVLAVLVAAVVELVRHQQLQRVVQVQAAKEIMEEQTQV
jgi:hypothetical protein